MYNLIPIQWLGVDGINSLMNFALSEYSETLQDGSSPDPFLGQSIEHTLWNMFHVLYKVSRSSCLICISVVPQGDWCKLCRGAWDWVITRKVFTRFQNLHYCLHLKLPKQCTFNYLQNCGGHVYWGMLLSAYHYWEFGSALLSCCWKISAEFYKTCNTWSRMGY